MKTKNNQNGINPWDELRARAVARLNNKQPPPEEDHGPVISNAMLFLAVFGGAFWIIVGLACCLLTAAQYEPLYQTLK